MHRRSALEGLIGLAAIPSIASSVQQSDSARTADVIVVDAGFAGLAAAKALRAAAIEALVLEARVRVGGRTCPGTIDGLTSDLGGMWVGPTQTRSAADRNDYFCPHDWHGRSHRIDRARKDGGHHPCEGECAQEPCQPSLCGYCVFGGLSTEWRSAAASERSEWNAEVTRPLFGVTLSRGQNPRLKASAGMPPERLLQNRSTL